MRRRALVLVLASLAFAGCAGAGGTSTSEFSGPERDVADAIADFASSATQKEESKACTESLSEALVDKVAAGGKSCPSELGKAFDDADGSVIEIDEITISGPRATADVYVEDRDDKKIRRTFTLVDEDGDWRIDSFGQI